MLSDNFSPNTLRPIFSHALSLKLEIIKLDAFIQNYSAGQILPGKVVQVLPEQKAVVEFQGEKLLLQFPRPVNPGQNITIKIKQIHPSPIIKLAEVSSSTSSQKIVPDNLAREALPLTTQVNTQQPDKTSIQNRSADSVLGSPASDKNTVPGAKNGQGALDRKVADPISKIDLKRLGIELGQRVKAEVLRVMDRESLQVRFKGNAVTIKHTTSQKLQPGELVTIHAKPIASGKFVLEVKQNPIPPSTARPPLELSF